MKNFLNLLLCSLLLFSINGFAGNPASYNNAIIVKTCYNSTDTIGTNKTPSSRETHAYTNDGRPLSIRYENYSGGTWTPSTGIYYYYYPNGDIDFRVLVNNDSTKTGSQKQTLRYFGKNKNSVQSSYYYKNNGFNDLQQVTTHYLFPKYGAVQYDSVSITQNVVNGVYSYYNRNTNYLDSRGRRIKYLFDYYDPSAKKYITQLTYIYHFNDTTLNQGISVYDVNNKLITYDTLGFDANGHNHYYLITNYSGSTITYRTLYTYEYSLKGLLERINSFSYNSTKKQFFLTSKSFYDSLNSADSTFTYNRDANGALTSATLYYCPESVTYSGINEINTTFQANWNIFPNPTENNITLQREVFQAHSNVIIRDMTGRILQKIELGNNIQTKILLEKLGKGMYLIELNSGEKNEVKMFIKQ